MIRDLRALPWLLATRGDRWVMRLHQPRNAGTAEKPIAVCTMHGRNAAPWPCREFGDASDRAARHDAVIDRLTDGRISA